MVGSSPSQAGRELEGGSARSRYVTYYLVDNFSLTPTLSRWEREFVAGCLRLRAVMLDAG